MKTAIKTITGEAFWVGAGILFSILALLAGTRILTALLSPTEYGKLALALSVAALCVHICGIPVAQTAVRFYSAYLQAGKIQDLTTFLTRSLSWAVGIIFFAGSALALMAQWIDGLPDKWFVFLTTLFAGCLVVNRIALGIEDAARKRRFRAVAQSGFEVGRFAAGIGMVIVLNDSRAWPVLTGFLMAAVPLIAAHVYYFRHRLFTGTPVSRGTPAQGGTAGQLTRFQLPLIISNGCIWVVMMTERWALQKYGTLSDVGGYTAVYQLSFVPMLFISSFLIIVTEPVMYQFVGLDHGTDAETRAFSVNRFIALAILTVSALLFIFLYFFHPQVSRFLLGPEFRHYSWLFPWLVLSGGFFATAQQLLLKLSCEMMTGRLAGLWAGVAITAILSYSAGACWWQLNGLMAAVVMVNGSLLLLSIPGFSAAGLLKNKQ